MKTVTVTKLKASLSEVLRQVKAGEEVLVSERGRPIARLMPAGARATLPRHLAEMEKRAGGPRADGPNPSIVAG